MSTASPTSPELSLIVPTYNERTRIAELVEAIFGVYGRSRIDGELIIVDDNSPDGTGHIADELATRYRVHVVHRAGKLGLGSAVMEGFNVARAPVVGVMDADFSHPPDLLPKLLDQLRRVDADVVVGSRYIAGGAAKNWPLVRLLMSRVACMLARPLTPVRDATSGFFLIRRSVVEGVHIQAGGFKILLELLMRSPVRTVAELPYEFVDRTIGQSKMSLREALGYFTQLRQLYAVKLAGRLRRPAYVRVDPASVAGPAVYSR
jgi:dolichol-phosphate mannosyltransferase